MPAAFPPQTILERLGRGPRDPAAPSSPAFLLRQSILRNLAIVLNTRPGSAAAQPEMGIPIPQELLRDYPASRDTIEAVVRRCIGVYEPRLKAIRIEFLEATGMNLRLRIQAEIADGEGEPFVIDSFVQPDGWMDVEP